MLAKKPWILSKEIKELEKIFANYVLQKLLTVEKEKKVEKLVKDQRVPRKSKAKSLKHIEKMLNFTHNKRNANYNYTETPFLVYQIGKHSRLKTHSVGELVGKLALLFIAGGSAKCYSPYAGEFGNLTKM